MAAELLVRLGIVRRERDRLGVRLGRLLRPPVFREQLGGAQARVERGGLDGERLAQKLERAVQIAAVEGQRDELAARLCVVESERQRLLQLRGSLLGLAQPPVRCRRGAMGASQIRSGLRGLDTQQRRAGGETDAIEGTGLGQQRIDPLRSGSTRLARQIQRCPALAPIEPVVRERVEQRGVVGVRGQRRLQRGAALVGVPILEPGESERSLRVLGGDVHHPLHRA